MMRKIIAAIVITICFSYVLSAQSQLLQNVNKIEIEKHGELGLIYKHQLEVGETLYSIARFFNIDLDDLLRLNKIKDVTDLDIGQVILIPFDTRMLDKSKDQKTDRGIPVIYTVEAKENLYRISKHYFDQAIDDMKYRNRLVNNDLSLGQELIVGWISPDISAGPIVNSIDERKADVANELTTDLLPITDTIGIYIKNELNADTAALVSMPKVLKQSKEIAIWNKEAPKTKHQFALHRHAAINSVIEILNPIINRTAFATVVGRIPEDSYPDDVTLIISPGVATALGALDRRFMVEVKYYQEILSQ